MNIAADTIPSEGLEITIDLDASWATQAAAHALEIEPTSLHGVVRVRRIADILKVQGSVRASAVRSCERCGEQVELVLDATDIELDYVPADPDRGSGELRLGESDLDVGWYENGALELSQVLSEVLALELPTRVVCLDPTPCDERVAELLAQAAPGVETSPFASLRDLF